jgi:nicotinamidase-related amidase
MSKTETEKKHIFYILPFLRFVKYPKLAGFLKELHKEKKIESIELIGLCTDICVVSNALLIKAFLPEVPISVTAGCCAGVTPEKHKSALETMKSCQIEVR